MASMNYKPRIAIVYSSKTGNTEELIQLLSHCFTRVYADVHIYRIEMFPILKIMEFDAIVIGTYTWGNGDVPMEMMELFHAFERLEVKDLVTGIAGTGDTCYPNFCGAVDVFRDMLFVHTNLAVTLKIELTPEKKDFGRCKQFVELIYKRLRNVCHSF